MLGYKNRLYTLLRKINLYYVYCIEHKLYFNGFHIQYYHIQYYYYRKDVPSKYQNYLGHLQHSGDLL